MNDKNTPPNSGGVFDVRALTLPLLIMASLSLALTLASDESWAQQPVPEVVLPSSDIMVTTRLDRTAVWVGDQFHYLIIVDYPSEYEFVLDNLTKETVTMNPL